MNDLKRVLSTALMLVPFIMFAQGTLSGVVTNSKTGEPVLGAKIYLEGSKYAGYSLQEGKYKITGIEVGTYKVVCSSVMLGVSEYEENVIITSGQTTNLDFKVGAEAKEIAPIVITIHTEHASEDAAVEEMKDEVKVVEIVSSEEMSKKGDSKATDAARRVSGVTVEGGRYVYVRGLSDRYSKTTLNGSEIPGLDPTRNSVQLDLFPTSFIGSMKIIKTFTPDLPADFTGGLIDIRTKEYPSKLTININGSLGYNTQSTFNSDFLIGKRGKLDWLGIDDGSRDAPKEYDKWKGTGEGPNQFNSTPKEYDDFVKSFNSEMTPSKQNNFFDHNLSFTLGNTVKIPLKKDTMRSRKWGYFGGVGYRREYFYTDDYEDNRYKITGELSTVDGMNEELALNGEMGTDYVLLGGIFNTTYIMNRHHKVGINFMRNQSTLNNGLYTEGKREDAGNAEDVFRGQSMGFTQRGLTSIQFHGTHEGDSLSFYKHKIKLDWKQAISFASQSQPDLRYFNDNSLGDEWVILSAAYGDPIRFYRQMNEVNSDTKIDLFLPFARHDSLEGKVKSGFSYNFRDRTREEYSPIYGNVPSDYNGNPDELFTDLVGYDFDNNKYLAGLTDQTIKGASYDATQTVVGVYGMVEYPISAKLDFIGGARIEKADMLTVTKNPLIPKGTLNDLDVLPSASFVYTLFSGKEKIMKDSSFADQTMKLIASYGRTLARPTFREKTQFSTIDFTNGDVWTGNPNLERTLIDNYDLRWEFYPRKGELISVSTYYKYLTSPIEVYLIPQAPNREFSFTNQDHSVLYGIELEYRRALDIISPKLKNFKIAANLTLSQSKVYLEKSGVDEIRENGVDPNSPYTRSMFGQSPYVLNVFFQYDNDSLGLNVNLAFNVFGERLSIINNNGQPHIYEQSRPTLDFNMNKKLGERWALTFRVKNILNPAYKWVYRYKGDSSDYDNVNDGNYVFRSFKKGTQFKLGFAYKF